MTMFLIRNDLPRRKKNAHVCHLIYSFYVKFNRIYQMNCGLRFFHRCYTTAPAPQQHQIQITSTRGTTKAQTKPAKNVPSVGATSPQKHHSDSREQQSASHTTSGRLLLSRDRPRRKHAEFLGGGLERLQTWVENVNLAFRF